jgi:hypothetical protein
MSVIGEPQDQYALFHVEHSCKATKLRRLFHVEQFLRYRNYRIGNNEAANTE